MSLVRRVVAAVVMWFTVYFYGAWWSMVMLGAAHSTNDAIPAFGFWTVFCLLASLSSIASAPMVYQRIADELDGR